MFGTVRAFRLEIESVGRGGLQDARSRRLWYALYIRVQAIMGFGKNFIPVDERELNAIRAVLKSGNYCEPWPFLQVGERVRVEYGPLAGTEGIVLMFKNACRLVISISKVQRAVAVEIDRDCLKPLRSQPATEPLKHIQ